jgi:hypothetical protein
MPISEVQIGSTQFDEVVALWRAHSKTLGFLPLGGFHDAALNRTVIAFTEEETVQGYLLYRHSRGQIAITHLCIIPACRGNGIAKLLTGELSTRHPEAAGIGLWCRRDYDANGVWPKVGFSARTYRQGRGKDRGTLVYWFKDHGHNDLFSYVEPARIEAAVDSSVLFDIIDEDFAPEKEESHSLLADWLQDSVRLLITPEMGNDIQRDNDDFRRAKHNSGKTIFPELRIPPAEFEKAERALLDVLPPPIDEPTRSDYRHLAWTKAAGIKYFITRDGGILANRSTLEQYDVRVLSPGEFVRHIDSLERVDHYRPEILFGTKFSLVDVCDKNIDRVETLAECSQGEKPNALKVAVRNLLANPRANRVRLLISSEESVHGLIGERHIEGASPIVSLLRLARNIQSSTLAHYIAYRLAQDAATHSPRTLTISDENLPEEFASALQAAGFESNGTQEYSRICCKGVMPLEQAMKNWKSLPEDKILREKQIWPTKIEDQNEPAYIVPIKPYYASNLFDHSLAGQSLFAGPNEKLLLQNECVYYSRTPIQFPSPARILWYVSKGRGYNDTSSIRACSFLLESVRGPAKQIFKRFRRFGIFEWPEILRLAKKDENGDITAIRFSHTECLPNPIPLSELLPSIGSAPAGPRHISHEIFLRLYRRAVSVKPL